MITGPDSIVDFLQYLWEGQLQVCEKWLDYGLGGYYLMVQSLTDGQL